MYHIEHLYKTVGGKNKQNLQVSIPKTLLAWVCVPAVKLDVAWVGKEVKSMNFHTGSACNVIMWKTKHEKPLQQNQLLLIIIYLQDVVPSKENGEGNGAMLTQTMQIHIFWSKKGTIQQSHNF